MARKLNTWVHVGERRYGPGDDVPDDVASQISNPDVWADEVPDPAEQTQNLVADVDDPTGRPRGNASRDTWADYACGRGVDVSDDMDRSAIIAAVDAKK